MDGYRWQSRPASFPGAGSPGTTVSLEPGFYSVVPLRGSPSGYSNSFSPGCSGAIAAGETRTCTITHDDVPGTLVVINEVANDNGGTAVPSDWTMTVTGANPLPASFSGTGASGTTVTLDAGAYTVSANGPAGYTSTLSADCDGMIGLGESKTCTITNDDQPATVVVVVEVVNDNGGSLVAGDVPVRVTGNNPSPAGFFPGQGPPGTAVTLDAGNHGLWYDTTSLAGYAGAGTDPDCVGTIAVGETKTCTLTFDDLPAELVVVTEVVNDDGGSALPGDFTVTVTGGDPSPASFAGESVPGTTVTLDAGGYSVDVSGPPGYTSTLSPDCAASIGLAETKTCTITSDDENESATLFVAVEVVMDNGGTLALSDFFTHISLPSGHTSSPRDFPAQGPPGTRVTLDPGSYGATVSGPGAVPWRRDFDPNCSGTIAAGETKLCTIVVDDVPATLLVIQEIVNDDGGSAVPGDFTVSVSGGDPSPASFPGHSAPGTSVTLDAGPYSVNVIGPPGYTSTFSPDCAAGAVLGDLTTCTITSDDQPPAVPRCDGKVATIVGAAGPTEIRGTSGSDVIVDLDGANVVRGRGGSDTICTGPGDDQIIAGDGNDTIIDTGGTNTIAAGAGADSITTGAGHDTVTAGAGADTVDEARATTSSTGKAAATSWPPVPATTRSTVEPAETRSPIRAAATPFREVTATMSSPPATAPTRSEEGEETTGSTPGAGNNSVNGQDGNDTLIAGAGNDWIDGSLGFDACTPGAGSNTVIRCEVVS